MCLRNVSGTVRVIKMTSANRLTASGCIASRWVYILIVNLLETPDGKFRDNMHTLTLVKFRTWDSWHSNQPCVWNADGDWHSFECGARRHFCEVTPDTNKQTNKPIKTLHFFALIFFSHHGGEKTFSCLVLKGLNHIKHTLEGNIYPWALLLGCLNSMHTSSPI